MAEDSRTIGYVLDRVRFTLDDVGRDSGGAVWTDATLIAYLNIAQREICNVRPEAHVSTEILDLKHGVTQQLPAAAKSLIDIACNVRADGSDDAAVNLMRREDADRSDSNWRREAEDGEVVEWAYDERNPRFFDVRPPNDGTGRLKIEVYSTPPDVGSDRGREDRIGLSDEYVNSLIYWICRLAYIENSTAPEYMRKSEEFRLMFYEGLGMQAETKTATEPNRDPAESGAGVGVASLGAAP